MTPEVQRWLAIALVAAAAAYLAWRGWRARRLSSRRGATGCGPGCGCG